MCTIVHVVLTPAADVGGVASLTEALKVGRGLREDPKCRRDLNAAGMLRYGERVYEILPWKRCHCGWSPAGFAQLPRQALDRGYARSVGLLVSEAGWPSDLARRELVRPDAFAGGAHNESDVLYMVEPDRSPRAIVVRHGSRKRKRGPDHFQGG